MKRIGNIYDEICSYENVRAAILNASKQKRSRVCVQKVLANLDEYAHKLSEDLSNETVKLMPYTVMFKTEGSQNKMREIHKPRFWPDQCVHWAVYNVLGPKLFRHFYQISCGSVPGRGAHYGKRFICKWLRDDRKHTKYYLKMDVRHYYPSIPNERMKTALRTKIKDERLLRLLDRIIDKDQGQPIGVLLSQVFANLYLTPLDYYIKQTLRAAHYIRYMDDMVVFGNSKRALHKMRREIENWLHNAGLEMKPNWQVCRTDSEPLDFMGFRFYRDHTALRRSIMLRITRRVKRVHRKGNRATAADAAAVISYMGWIKNSDSQVLFEKWIKPYLHLGHLKNLIRREQKKRNENIDLSKHGTAA